MTLWPLYTMCCYSVWLLHGYVSLNILMCLKESLHCLSFSFPLIVDSAQLSGLTPSHLSVSKYFFNVFRNQIFYQEIILMGITLVWSLPQSPQQRNGLLLISGGRAYKQGLRRDFVDFFLVTEVLWKSHRHYVIPSSVANHAALDQKSFSSSNYFEQRIGSPDLLSTGFDPWPYHGRRIQGSLRTHTHTYAYIYTHIHTQTHSPLIS